MKFTFPPESRPLAGYTIKRAIDRGGFGEVYYALNDAGKEVALKLLQHNLDVELRGVRQCLNLRHPNLITIFDIRTDDDEDHWIVMEYAGGKTLEQTLAAGPHQLAASDALEWIRGIAEGVEFLHARGLVHRDLKPGNIFNDQGTVKVGDVGLSKFITPSRRSAQTESVGTVHYMAPEVARGRYGKEVDVYAAGVILYEMLVGKVPFEGESTAEILMKHLTASPDLDPVPEGLRPLIARALEKDPERRLESISELVRGLDQFLAGKQPFVPERKRETIQESIDRTQAAAVQNQPQPGPRQPAVAAASDSSSGDELDDFWRHVSLFFRPERLFFTRVGRTLYSQWKQDIPGWIRWSVGLFVLLSSPVWLIVLLASTPWILFTALIYFGVREVVRVGIWMANPPAGTHPWTRLFGGSSTLDFESIPNHQQEGVYSRQSPATSQSAASINSAPFGSASEFAPSPPLQAVPQQHPVGNRRNPLSILDRWFGLPLLGLAGCVVLLFAEAVRYHDTVPFALMASSGAFVLIKLVVSLLLKHRAVPVSGRRRLNLVLFSLAIFSTILVMATVHIMDTHPRGRLNDEGGIAIFLALFGFGVSAFFIRRRFELTERLPPAEFSQHIEDPVPPRIPHPGYSSKIFGWGLAAIFVVLVTLSAGSIFLATLAPSAGNVNINGVRIQTHSFRFTALGALFPVIIAGGLYFLFRKSMGNRSPEVSGTSAVAAERATQADPQHPKQRQSEFWLVTAFLALWFSLTLGWWKGVAPATVDGSWAAFFFYPDSWAGITAVAWSEIILLGLLIGKCVPKIPLQTQVDSDPRLAHLRIATGFFQSLLWSFLLSAGFAFTILALSDRSPSGWNPGRPWDASSGSYPHAVWLFCFLVSSSTILLTQSYLRTRYGFLRSSSFFTLLLSGILIAAVSIGLDGTLGSMFPHRGNLAGEGWLGLYVSSLQFFLPTMICGGWLGQIDPARPRRFRLSRLIWVIVVTATVGGILEFDHHPDCLELWVFLMGGLSGVVQLGSLWADPDESVKSSATIQNDPHYYNLSLVQGA